MRGKERFCAFCVPMFCTGKRSEKSSSLHQRFLLHRGSLDPPALRPAVRLGSAGLRAGIRRPRLPPMAQIVCGSVRRTRAPICSPFFCVCVIGICNRRMPAGTPALPRIAARARCAGRRTPRGEERKSKAPAGCRRYEPKSGGPNCGAFRPLIGSPSILVLRLKYH